MGFTVGGWWGAAIGAFIGAFVANRRGFPDDPRFGGRPETLPILNQASADEPLPVYYGFCPKVDPIVVFRDARNINFFVSVRAYTFVVAVIGEGEIESVDAIYLDGVIVTDPRFAGSVMYEVNLGSDTQGPVNFLWAQLSDKFNSSDVGKGVAYVVFALAVNTLAFPGREPRIQIDIRGKKPKDTRDGISRFSPNPALAIRDFWTNTRYGRKVAEAKINDAKITAEANYFEERVAIPSIVSTFTADAATDLLTLPAAQSLFTGNQVLLTTSGALPGGLALATVYYWIRASDATGKLATTLANAQAGTAIDITTAGAGVHTLTTTSIHDAATVYMTGGVPWLTQNAIVFAKDVPFDNGDGVRVSSTGVLPQGLAAGTTYYWIRGFGPSAFFFQTPAGVTTERTGRLASSYANALAGVAMAIGPAGNTGTLSVTHFDQPRYTCSGRLDPYANPLDSLAALRSSCRSWFFESAGLYHLVADKITAPSAFALTPDNMVGKWDIELGDPAGHVNRIEAHFWSALLGDKDLALSESSAELAADGGRLMSRTLQLDFTTNYYMAQRLAQLERRCSRIGMRVALTTHIQGFEALVGDVVACTHPDPGFAGKLFRIARIDLSENDEYEMELTEYADSVYTMDAQAATIMPLRTNLPGTQSQVPTSPPNVSGLEIFTP